MYPTSLQKCTPNTSTTKTGYLGWTKVKADQNFDTFNLDTSMGMAWKH
jgi:hypothetical protein